VLLIRSLGLTRLGSLLEEYYAKFGDKPSCFEDLLPYVGLEGDDPTQWTRLLDETSITFVGGLSP